MATTGKFTGVTFQVVFFDDFVCFFKISDVSDCVKILLTTFSAFFQKSKNLPTTYLLSRRYVLGDKFFFFHFF
jgi:hypothetical protein